MNVNSMDQELFGLADNACVLALGILNLLRAKAGYRTFRFRDIGIFKIMNIVKTNRDR